MTATFAAFAAGLALNAPLAFGCTRTKHCHVLIESKASTFEAGIADIESSLMTALPGDDFISNEQWTLFSTETEPWVEVGDTTGIYYFEGEKHYTGVPLYFWAYYPDGKKPYTGAQEWYLTTGPGLGQWFEATEVAEGDDGWCAKINNIEMGCGGGFSEYATWIESGLEIDAEIPPEDLNNTNSATSEIYELNLEGHLIEPAVKTPKPKTPGVTWCYQWPVDGHATWFDYGTGPPPCSSGQETTNTIALAGRSLEAGDALAWAPTIEAAEPEETYETSTGPELSSTQLVSDADRVVDAEGDSMPKYAELVRTTLGQAASVVDPSFSVASSSPGMSRWWNSDVAVVVLHGDFSVPSAAMAPRAEGVPSGTVLDLIVDSHTGALDSIRIDDKAPVSLDSLGLVDDVG